MDSLFSHSEQSSGVSPFPNPPLPTKIMQIKASMPRLDLTVSAVRKLIGWILPVDYIIKDYPFGDGLPVKIDKRILAWSWDREKIIKVDDILQQVRFEYSKPEQSYIFSSLALAVIVPLMKLVVDAPPYWSADDLARIPSQFALFGSTIQPTLEFGPVFAARYGALITLLGMSSGDECARTRECMCFNGDFLKGASRMIVSLYLRMVNPFQISQELLSPPPGTLLDQGIGVSWVALTVNFIKSMTLFAIEAPHLVHGVWTEANEGYMMMSLKFVCEMAMMGTVSAHPFEALLNGPHPDQGLLHNAIVRRFLRLMNDTHPDGSPVLDWFSNWPGAKERLALRVAAYKLAWKGDGSYGPVLVCFSCGIVAKGEEEVATMLDCSYCSFMTYCSTLCRKQHWEIHETPCAGAHSHS